MSHRYIATLVISGMMAGTGSSTATADEKQTVVCESDASGHGLSCREAWRGEDAAPFRRIAPDSAAPIGTAPRPAQPILAKPSTRLPQAAAAPAYLRGATSVDHPSTTVSTLVKPATPVDRVAPATATEGSMPAMPSDASKPTATADARAIAGSQNAKSGVAEPQSTPLPSAVSVSTTAPPSAISTPPLRESPKAAATTPAVVTVIPTSESPIVAQPSSPPTTEMKAEDRARTTTSTTPAVPPSSATAAPVARLEAPLEAENARDSVSAATVLDGRAFASLPGSRYTLELANARAPQPLRELAARLRLSGALYLIHLRNPDADRWLLVWSDHASQAEARSARQWVAADPAINSGWPRRIAPLQNELVFP